MMSITAFRRGTHRHLECAAIKDHGKQQAGHLFLVVLWTLVIRNGGKGGQQTLVKLCQVSIM